jgi:ParB family chromosome partitioning protein
MTDEQKAARAEVIANNKAWDSATTVRRAWLTTFFARKTAPPDGARWIVQTLAQGSHDMRKAMESDHSVALELLGLNQSTRGYARMRTHSIAGAAAKASPARATTLTVAMLVGALENGTDRRVWRSPTGEQIAYFRQLQRWNYPLSDVEMLVLQPTDADEPNPLEPALDEEPEPADEEPGGAGDLDGQDIAA